MIYLHKILPALLSPYSLFLACIIIGLVKRKYLIIWAALIGVLILSMPVVSSFLFAQLETVGSRKTPEDVYPADAIVVLSEGEERLAFRQRSFIVLIKTATLSL